MLGRRGRPGLLGTMARTAVIAGTATAVSGNVAARQNAAAQSQTASQQAAVNQAVAQQMAAQQAPAPAAPAPAANDVMAQLSQLSQMHSAGLITGDEFAAAKAKLLGI